MPGAIFPWEKQRPAAIPAIRSTTATETPRPVEPVPGMHGARPGQRMAGPRLRAVHGGGGTGIAAVAARSSSVAVDAAGTPDDPALPVYRRCAFSDRHPC